MNILITGGSGFIGCNLAEYFSRHFRVTVFDSLSRPGSEKNTLWLQNLKRRNLHIIRGNITDTNKLSTLVKDVDAVFHLAAQVAVTNSVTDPQTDFEINTVGTFRLLEAIRKSENKPLLVYASTNKVYGNLNKGLGSRVKGKGENKPVGEEQPLDFYSPYACSKGAADCYVHDYFRIYDIPTVVFRKSCIYGVRQFGTEDQGWVAHFVRRAIAGQPITIYGNGKQIRDLLYIDDLILLYEKVLFNKYKSAGQIFNVGGGVKNSIDLLSLIKKIEKIRQQKIQITFASVRPGDQPFYVSDITKAQKILGWKPNISIDEGLSKLINWVVETSS